MRIKIEDSEALRAISPAALVAYARSAGWHYLEVYGEYGDVYAGNNLPEIILPRTERLADYPSVVASLIDVFARTQDADELVTYRTLVGAEHDVIRVRALGAKEDGSISLEHGVTIVTQAREMLLAAACAAKQPQALYRAGANKDAVDYLHRVRLGQTEHGSFVVTLLSPVPPTLQQPLFFDWPDLSFEPPERRVTRSLAGALTATRKAIDLGMRSDGASFFDAVENGVSANFCEALSRLTDHSDGLEVSIAWARTRPAPIAISRQEYSQADAEVLDEAARLLRAREPRPDQELFARVIKLKRDFEEVEGLVTLKALVDGKVQSVQAVFDKKNYGIAVNAHDKKSIVRVFGDLERNRNRWRINNAMIESIDIDDEDLDQE